MFNFLGTKMSTPKVVKRMSIVLLRWDTLVPWSAHEFLCAT